MSTLTKALVLPSIDDEIAAICGTDSLLRSLSHIKKLQKNTEARSQEHLREILESALAREVRSKPQRRSIIQALRNAIKKLPAKPSLPSPPSKTAKSVTVEVVSKTDAVLTDAAFAIAKHHKIIEKRLAACADEILCPTLQIGLQCLKAHQVFTIPDHGKRNKSGKNQHSTGQLTRELASPAGFNGWLTSEAQWLKEPTAYKYMTAVRGLGLDHTATEKQVVQELKTMRRKGKVTLKMLCDLALESVAPPAAPPVKIEQQEFDFLRQSLTAFREETESLLRCKDKLEAHPDFKRAAVARIYAALHELTGTHWKPSDEPDDLALIDPDAITI